MIWSILIGIGIVLAMALPFMFFIEARLEGVAIIWLLLLAGGWIGYLSWVSGEEAKAVQQPTVIELSVDNA